MKRRYYYLFAAMMISGISLAQKSELRDAERAIKKGNESEAKAALGKVEALLSNANEAQKAQYYFLKGNLSVEMLRKNKDFDANVENVIDAYGKLFEVEKNENHKYVKQAKEELKEVSQQVINKGIEANNASNYKVAGKQFLRAYDLNPQDTVYLYYAASMAVNTKDYDNAIKHYKKLVDLGYTGQDSYYTAVEKASGQVQSFGKDSKMRDLMIKQGTHTDPKFVKEDSKRPEIIKNLALIYNQEGKTAEAEEAIAEARKANPNDTDLLLTQMDLALKAKNMGKYEELAKEALAQKPNDDLMLYNLGVISYQAGNYEEAKKYYEKAISINPRAENAYLNLAVLKLQPDEEITNKMNSLGMSAADNKKYEELKKQKNAIYDDARKDLEKVLEINKDNEEAKSTLKGIYRALEMNDKLKALE